MVREYSHSQGRSTRSPRACFKVYSLGPWVGILKSWRERAGVGSSDASPHQSRDGKEMEMQRCIIIPALLKISSN